MNNRKKKLTIAITSAGLVMAAVVLLLLWRSCSGKTIEPDASMSLSEAESAATRQLEPETEEPSESSSTAMRSSQESVPQNTGGEEESTNPEESGKDASSQDDSEERETESSNQETTMSSTELSSSETVPPSTTEAAASSEHEHNWVAVTETVHHDEVVRVIEHPEEGHTETRKTEGYDEAIVIGDIYEFLDQIDIYGHTVSVNDNGKTEIHECCNFCNADLTVMSLDDHYQHALRCYVPTFTEGYMEQSTRPPEEQAEQRQIYTDDFTAMMQRLFATGNPDEFYFSYHDEVVIVDPRPCVCIDGVYYFPGDTYIVHHEGTEEEIYVVDREAWTESVVEETAYDEEVVTGYRCSSCGAEN